ncbi:FtsJ methyltransferase domain-containing protein 2 [Chytridiales sp. JEL 0842]|nr:FtsJ methyltransferase domain-containing protein 2 [Chytridiales sp. JEL 0842]
MLQNGRHHHQFGSPHHQSAIPQPQYTPVPIEQQVHWLQFPADAKLPVLDGNVLKMTVEKSKPNNYNAFCDDSLVLEFFSLKTNVLSSLAPEQFTKARNSQNAYEYLGKSVFINRSAVKMANLDKAGSFIASWVESNGNDTSTPLYFADLCSGPGGFSEYMLWRCSRLGIKCKGWGITLRGDQDFQVNRFEPTARRMAQEGGGFEAFYGADGSGDICSVDNVNAFEDYIRRGTSDRLVDIVMADGGDELHQENHSKGIFVGQVLTMLKTLRPGGSFTIKIFHSYTPFTAGILYILSRFFKNFGLVKPFTSRPANSECYVVCTQFCPPSTEESRNVVDHLVQVLNQLYSLRRSTAGPTESSISNNSGSAAPLSSHTQPPMGFVSQVEKVALGLLDVTEVVNMDVLKQDPFHKFLKEFNVQMTIHEKDALTAIEKRARNESGVPVYDQAEIRRQIYMAWDLPL